MRVGNVSKAAIAGNSTSIACSAASKSCWDKHAAVVVYLERSHSRREFQNACQWIGLQIGHQLMHSKAQIQIQHQWAIFNQQILIASLTIGDSNLRLR
jgi:hypothetical protein